MNEGMTDLQFREMLHMILTIMRKSKDLEEAIGEVQKLLDQK